jgi:hypothetical protein
VTLPLSDPAYVQLAALEHMGCAAARVSVDRPYAVRLVRAALVAANAESACRGPILTALESRFAIHAADTAQGVRVGAAATVLATGLHGGTFEPLWQDVRPTSAGEPPAIGEMHGRLTYGDGDHVAVVMDGYGETSVRNDPTVRAKRLRHTSGIVDFSEAYGAARAGVFTFTIGRGQEAWLGEGTESLVLSANGPAYDRVAAEFHTAHFEGRAIFGSLDDVSMDSAQDSITSTIGPQRFYRYVAGHSFTWRPSRAIEITAGETALLSRGSQTVDFYYLNPFVPYQFVQHDSGRTGDDARDNLTAFGAVRGRLGRVTASAELLIDDIQIDAARRTNTPDQLGYDLVLSAPVPAPIPASVMVEYERIDTYTYERGFYTEVYQHYNAPLGSVLGPDADYGRVAGELLPVPWLRVSGDVGLWQRGLQRIDERPGQESVGHPSLVFPSSSTGHPVESAVLVDGSLQLLNATFPITATVQLARIRNVNNLPTAATLYGRVQLSATYAFRYP